ncbi:response regulator [Hymenobacter humi]|uniref:Response regulator n=1 Tax=Hymenobacter humi TaxID=1411620 RepID=A0ABW2UA85_9BACT
MALQATGVDVQRGRGRSGPARKAGRGRRAGPRHRPGSGPRPPAAARSEALEDLAAEAQPSSPVLVLLDVKMPGMDGMAFVDAYQRLPADRQQAVVIVLHTASMSSVDLGRIDSLPIAGLVSKPLTKEKLDTILKLHFQRRFPTT